MMIGMTTAGAFAIAGYVFGVQGMAVVMCVSCLLYAVDDIVARACGKE